MQNIIFYKYIKIEDPQKLRDGQFALCRSLDLKGKILIASEGINGSLTGEEQQIKKYSRLIRTDPRFTNLDIKTVNTDQHDFNKLFVKIRKKIITTKSWDASPAMAAPYLEPEELKKWLEQGEEVLLIDARNQYESRIGHFQNAILADIKTFDELPKAAKKWDHLKEKKIVTYCTGGIRCEKASAYLRESGFTKVFQLRGGILKYALHCGSAFWQGRCFVFDKRGAVPLDPQKEIEPIARCDHCNVPADEYYNCRNIDCDKRIILCEDCLKNLESCCSKQCRNSVRNQLFSRI